MANRPLGTGVVIAVAVLLVLAIGVFGVANDYWKRARSLRCVVSLEDAKSRGQALVLPEDQDRLPREESDNALIEGAEQSPSWPGRLQERQLGIGHDYLAVLTED